MGRAEPPESARDVDTLPSSSRDWSKESGTRQRVALDSLVDDTQEVITTVEPWRLRVSASGPRSR